LKYLDLVTGVPVCFAFIEGRADRYIRDYIVYIFSWINRPESYGP
jgi:hypothetical protein